MIKQIIGTIIGVVLAVALIGAVSSRMGEENTSSTKGTPSASECSELFLSDEFAAALEVG